MDTSSVPSALLTPIIQYGFAGLSAVLLVFIGWLVNKLLSAMKDSTAALTANTEVIRSFTGMVERQIDITNDIRDLLLSRPCIAQFRTDPVAPPVTIPNK